MYRIYNKSLDVVLKGYNTHSLDELTNDQLTRLSESLGLPAVPKRDEKTAKFYGFDRDQTMKGIENYLTFSLYMGDGYWEERHLGKVKEAEIDSRLGKMKTGDEVFEIMSRHKLGFYKLRPGSSSDVDWTERYMEEFFKKVPFYKYCDVTDLSTGQIYGKTEEVKPEIKAETKEETEKILSEAIAESTKKLTADLESLPFKSLVVLAREKGIEKPTFKSRDMLIRLLKQ